MNDLSNERLAVLIQRFDVEFARFRGVADGETADALRELLEARARLAGVPETHVIVPREPTEVMTKAGNAADYGASTHRPAAIIYRAMLSASEQPR